MVHVGVWAQGKAFQSKQIASGSLRALLLPCALSTQPTAGRNRSTLSTAAAVHAIRAQSPRTCGHSWMTKLKLTMSSELDSKGDFSARPCM